MPEKRIFISYRRSDTAGHAGRLYDQLKNYFGEDRVFFDVDTIKPGTNFEQKINNELDQSGAVLVLIGKQWLDLKDAAGSRRLDDPQDYVRMEVGTALKKDVTVIPVLVQGAEIPSGRDLPPELYDLSRRNAIRLEDDQWNADYKMLALTLRNVLGISRSRRDQRIRRYRQVVVFLSLLGAVLAILNQLNLFVASPSLAFAFKLILYLTLGTNVPFVAFLLGSLKQELDRLSWTIIGFALLGSFLTAWGGALTVWAAVVMVIVAGLLNFTEVEE